MTIGRCALALFVCAESGTLAACGGPIEWRGDETAVVLPAGVAAAGSFAEDEAAVVDGSVRLVLTRDGAVALEGVARPRTAPAAADPSACPGSLRTSAPSGGVIHGVWWSVRPGGRAALLAARSNDGGSAWSDPVPVDTTDQSVVACSRPAPAIAADPASGYVHVTYFLRGREGAGVFLSHSVERPALFHTPVPILYGERPAATAVTAADSVVIVAFENPNSPRRQISLAVSRTWGHSFPRDRTDASNAATPAHAPLVAMRGDTILVGWRDAAGRVVARVGRFR